MFHARIIQGGMHQQRRRLVKDGHDARVDRDLGIDLEIAVVEMMSEQQLRKQQEQEI